MGHEAKLTAGSSKNKRSSKPTTLMRCTAQAVTLIAPRMVQRFSKHLALDAARKLGGLFRTFQKL
eukprot:CAMPEP_0183604332 /NCGR_PEP_ID=MMETSP0371-20130417/181894_1 /TAXON_ID=268820 /ORGANISM="Peridinium aciculiferum, Strain PAER-2" /LENGTH=64 /DNA_ID=CAMNT_0025816429 /DNA_START=351 /DNA_END=544 /DNA_ORIENTATION=+